MTTKNVQPDVVKLIQQQSRTQSGSPFIYRLTGFMIQVGLCNVILVIRCK